MFIEVLPSGSESTLASLEEVARGFYLAGGTGLALQLGHRISGDFDFFSDKVFEPWVLSSRLSEAGRFVVSSEAKGTLHGVFESTKVSFLHYKYRLLFPTIKLQNVEVADYRDIALMKITAISGRGSKKDFVDLYFACQKETLPYFLKLFNRKYREANYSKYHILRSLTYFDDAEEEPNPVMLKPWSWEDIKTYFVTEVVKAAADLQ